MKNKKRNSQWIRLDNAAKIFPAATRKQDTKVFRFVCELNEIVKEEILQNSLDLTLKEFPVFQTVMRRGLFWYYLEDSERKAIVHIENKQPCAPLYDPNRKGLLFDVSYYKQRINLEVYHSLTDGTGAMAFLRTLVYHYLILVHKREFEGEEISLDYDASAMQKGDDSFNRYYEKKRKDKSRPKQKIDKKYDAYKIKGAKLSEYRMKVIRGTFSLKKLKEIVEEYHTSITVFLTALVIESIGEFMTVRDKKHPVGIVVPVNLRNYFKSESVRNFFGTIDVMYDFEKNTGEFQDIIKKVEECFENELTEENLRERLYALGSLERNPFARVVPLVIKDFFMRIGYDISERKYTFSISNIGKISMPKQLEPYIHLFDVFISTAKAQVCMCSFQDNITMSFTSPFISAELEKNFFRKLTSRGIDVEIATNQWDEE